MIGETKEEIYKIGDEIDFYCSKCRLNLHGNVAAVSTGGKALKVTCRTCHFTGPYKVEKTDAEIRGKMLKRALAMRDARTSRTADLTRATQPSGGTDVTKRWRKLTEDVDSRHASMYAPHKAFEEGDALIHKQHGLGVVTQVLHDNAFVALFRTVEVPLEMNAPEQQNMEG